MLAATVALVFAFAAAMCFWRVQRYRSWFRLPASRTDRLTCRVAHQVISAVVGPDGFDLPVGFDLRGRTVLLQLTVRVLPLGRLVDPSIECSDGRATHRQYFERGAIGQRYLNLSPIFQGGKQDPPLRVSLRGSSMRWEPEASLLVFDPPDIEGATVLVLAPHPDDAEIAAFGLCASHRSWVVTVTAGEKGTGNLPSGIPTHARSRWTASLRVYDSLSVPQLGQVPPGRRANLVFPDGALESMYREPARPFQLACEDSLGRAQLRSENSMSEFKGGKAGCSWNDLIEEMSLVLEMAQPDIIVCPHPLIDSHSDHIYTTVALDRAMRNFTVKRPLLFLYAVHNRGAPIYPLGPAESLIGLPPGQYDAWVADSIYSYPLKTGIQQAKYFAVEAMHGARTARSHDDALPKGCLDALGSVRREISAYVAGMSFDPASLLRRAPRPNEIYYVVQGDKLTEMLERRLESPRNTDL
jgi:LmbE family N-acetylglucosaminyl deacetylase